MIARVNGWSWDVEGEAVMLRPRDAPRTGSIRYRERRPRKGLDAAMADCIVAARFEPAEVGAPHSFVTAEGEYGQIAQARGVVSGAQAALIAAVVLADDWQSETAALVTDLEHADRFARAVAEVARGDRLRLGIRPRRYRFARPTGWLAEPTLPLHTRWRCPDSGAVIVTHPATPIDAELDIGPPIGGSLTAEIGAASRVETAQLRGRRDGFKVVTEAGTPARRDVVVLSDATYAYPLFVEFDGKSLPAGVEDAFGATVNSIEPVPVGTQNARGAFSHLTEI